MLCALDLVNIAQGIISVDSNSNNSFRSPNEQIFNISNNIGHSENPQIIKNGKHMFLVWINDTSGSRDIYFRKSSDNGASFEKIRNLGNNTGFNGFPQVAASGNNVYVVWTNNLQEKYRQIFFTRSTDDGASFDTPFIVSERKDSNIGNMVFSPRLAPDTRPTI